MQHQRPAHNPSANLSARELECLYGILGHDRITLATAVAQILYGHNHVWQKQACGVLCYVKDYNRKLYSFCLYNLKSKAAIFEETVPIALTLEKVLDRFYTFNGMHSTIGINFVDDMEAEAFSRQFHEMQAQRQIKRVVLLSDNQSSAVVVNRTNTSSPSSTARKSKIEPKTLKALKKASKKRHPLISEPIVKSFKQPMHIGLDGSFVNDPEKAQLFNQVLSKMCMTPEDEIYVRNTVNSVQDGLNKLFTQPILNDQSQGQSMSNRPLIKKILKRMPYQDISLPFITFQRINPLLSNVPVIPEKPKPPPLLPKPVSPPSTTSSKAMRAPPPPVPPKSRNTTIPPVSPPAVPADFEKSNMPPPIAPRPIKITIQNPNTSPSTLPPPPPPLPMDLFTPKENINISSSRSSPTPNQTTTQSPTSPETNSLLEQIRNFNTPLKPIADRPNVTTKPTENGTNVDAHRTLEENIRLILDKRRVDIMGCDDDQDNTSETDEDEWDA